MKGESITLTSAPNRNGVICGIDVSSLDSLRSVRPRCVATYSDTALSSRAIPKATHAASGANDQPCIDGPLRGRLAEKLAEQASDFYERQGYI